MNTKTNRSLIVSLVLLIAVLAALSVLPPAAKQANAATYQHHHQAVTITAVEASPLNGVTPGRTYQSSDLDKTASNVVELGPRCDIVDIYAYGTGSAAQTATLKIWAYSANGPARLVWSGTAAIQYLQAIHLLQLLAFSYLTSLHI